MLSTLSLIQTLFKGTNNMPGALRKCIRSLLDQIEEGGESKRNANMSKLFSVIEDYGPLADNNSPDVRNVYKVSRNQNNELTLDHEKLMF